MDIEIDMKVVDKSGQALGTVAQIINDMWTGKPRKYVVHLENGEDIAFFKPDQVSTVEAGKVTLSLDATDIETI